MRITALFSLLALIMLTASSCALKVYLVDRQTVLEDEAAGEWPEFEKEILSKSEASTPTPFATVADSAARERLFSVLNGELVANATPAKAAPSGGAEAGKAAKRAPQGRRQ